MSRGMNASPGLPHRRRHRNDGGFKTLHVAFGVIMGVIIGFTLGVALIGGGRSSSSATLGLATCQKDVLVVAQRSDSPTAATGNGHDGTTSLRPTSPPPSTSTTTTTTSAAAISTTTARPATLSPSSVVVADSDVCFDEVEKGMGDVQMPLPAKMVFARAHRYIQAKTEDGKYENVKFVDHNPVGATVASPSGTGKAPVLTSESKVLIFTVCMHGWGVVHRHGDVYALCDPWWKVMSEAFAPHSKVAVALISDHEEASKRFRVDTTRAPHWSKIAFSHAFLRDDAPGGPYDLVIFADADAVVMRPRWNPRSWANTMMGEEGLYLGAEDDWDFMSTGEMFMKRDPRTLAWLEAWYGETPQFYGRLSYGNELKDVMVTEHCSELHPTGCQTTRHEFNARSNIRKWWTGTLAGATDVWQGGPVAHYHLEGGHCKQDGGEATCDQDPYHDTKEQHSGKAVVARCWPWHPVHEQGCLTHLYIAHPDMLKHLVVIPKSALHRLFKNQGSSKDIFFHPCCRSYADRASMMMQCYEPVKAGRDC